MSNELVKSAAVATAKTACCAVIGMAGGHFGMLLLGGLGVAGAAAASGPVKEILGFATEKASEIVAEIGLEYLPERERNDPLARVFNQSLRRALREIKTDAASRLAISGTGALNADWDQWFDNWDRALEAPLLDDFGQIQLGPDTTEEAERRLCACLALLNAQGGMLNPKTKKSASHRLISFQSDQLDQPGPALVELLKERLPVVLPPIFDDLLTSERNNQANKQYVNKFIERFKDLYGPAILEIKETVVSIKDDTRLLPGMDAKLDKLLDGNHGAVSTHKHMPQNLPFASLGDLFKGREADLKRLEDQLEKHGAAAIVQPASITGMGGIGKTRLAVEYALRNQEKFSALLFVSANTRDELGANLAQLSSPEVLDLPVYGTGNQPNQYTAVVQWLQDNHGWLLILDNADTPEAVQAVRKLVPKLSGRQVLITSRIGTWGASVHAIGLHLLSEEAAVSYLLDRTEGHRQPQPQDEAQAGLVAEDLGCLALALEQAAAYINAQAISFAEYRARWQASNAKLIEFHDKLSMDYPKSVAVTLQTTIGELSAEGRRLLDILAWLAPDPIPRLLIEARGGPLAAGSEDGLPEGDLPAAVEQAEIALTELARFSLASFSEDKQSFFVHRLVQAVARGGQSETRQHQCATAALRWVNAGFPNDSGDVRFWPVAEALAPHARAVINEADRLEIPEPTTRLMNQLGLFLKSRAEWGQAEPLYRRALAIDEKSYGSEHPLVAIRLNNLAALLQATNRLQEAEPLMRRALAIDEKSLGPVHPNVAIRLNNLASLLQATNRLQEAEPLMRRALAIDEKSYGSDHPEVATDLNNLASLLKATNRLQEAEPLMSRVVAIFEKSLGPDHPNVATALNNLAQLLKATNRLKEAEPLMRRALGIDEKSYGSDHPEVATDLNNLAGLLQATNRLGEAEPLLRRVIAIFENSLGPDHPNLATALNNLAQLLQATDRLQEAEPLMRRALEIDEKSYGGDHPNVAIRLNNLAQLLQATNRLQEAEPLMRRVLAIDEKSYGSDHPDVAIDLNNLAQLLQATNRLHEAEPLMRRALAIDEKSYGSDHPDVAIDLNNLAQLLQATNRLAEAEPLMRHALEIDEKSYGGDHPNVAICLNNLASLLQATNRFQEAEPLMRRALAIDEKSYGSDHPLVAIRLSNLASLLQGTNRPQEAEPLMRRALAIDEKSYGSDHPLVAIRLNNLASLLQGTNRPQEAEPLMRRHLEIFIKFTRSTGHLHPHLQDAINNYGGLLLETGMSREQVLARLREMAPEFFK